MTTTSADPLFVDTNILIYSTDPTSQWYAAARTALRVSESRGELLTLSPQILREFIAASTRALALAGAPTIDAILANVSIFRTSFTVVRECDAVIAALARIIQQTPVAGKQVHDANIVATMQVHGITRLLTNNESHFTRFSHLITTVPLRSFL